MFVRFKTSRFVLTIFVMTLIIIWYNSSRLAYKSFKMKDDFRNKTLKSILLWRTGKKSHTWTVGEKTFKFLACPESRCVMTNDKTKLPENKFDAIVFDKPNLMEIPINRSSHQQYIFAFRKQQLIDGIYPKLFFNLTSKSSIQIPIIIFQKSNMSLIFQ